MALYTTEFFVPENIGVKVFADALREKFPDGRVWLKDKSGDRLLIQGRVFSDQENALIPFWEDFCKKYNIDPSYKPPCWIGDK